MRDIRNLLEQIVNQLNFELVDYIDKKGEKRHSFNLTKKGCLILASCYNAKLREKIIDRWEELEIEMRNGGYQCQARFVKPCSLPLSSKNNWNNKKTD